MLEKTVFRAVGARRGGGGQSPVENTELLICGRSLTKTQVCAHSERKNAVDTCPGDSGGPMSMSVTSGMIMKNNKRKSPSQKKKIEMYNQMERYQLEGITSWGFGCGQKLPGVYTKVSHFMDFILEHSKYIQTVENEMLSKRL